MVQANADGRRSPAGPAVGRAGPPGGVLPQRQHRLGTPPWDCLRGPRDFLLTCVARGPILLGVPNGQRVGQVEGLGSGALGSHARCGARRYSFVGLGFQKPGFLI